MRFSDIQRLVNSIYDRVMTPIEQAKQLGTYNAIDRSRQYFHQDPKDLLRAVNEAWAKIRSCEKELTKRDQKIADLQRKLDRAKLINAGLTFVVIGLWELWKFLIQLQLK